MVLERKRARPREGGATLMVVLFAMIIGTLSAVVTGLNHGTHTLPTQRDALTRTVLEEAKGALIAFAADNRHRPGGLPCPDLDGDGEAELACDKAERRVGLYPWQTLRAGRLLDASGAPLWYAVSGSIRNDADVAINSLVEGELVVGEGARTTNAVAVLFAPNAALPGQHRTRPVAALRGAFLEGDNARATTRFTTTDGNDVVSPLTADELFRAVDGVVASRIRAEIVPIFVRRYVEAWGALPWAVPLEDPRSSPLRDPSRERAAAGLLPVAPDPTWVHWDAATIRMTAEDDRGVVEANDCARSIATEIRCTLRPGAGVARIRIAARAMNVGYALVAPPAADDTDFGADGIAARIVEPGPIDADGGATIVAHATVAVRAGRATTVHLVAPRPIRELTDRHLPVSADGAWFTRNEWFRTLLLHATPDALPGRASTAGERTCDGDGSCLLLELAGRRWQAPGALVFTGRPRAGTAAIVDRLLEDGIAHSTDGVLREPPFRHAGNDAIFPLCALPLARCVTPR